MLKKVLIILICLFIFCLTAKEVFAFNFSISVNPQQGTIDKGGTLKTAINIYSASSDWQDTWETLSLFASVEPKGTRISFYPSYCRPPCSSVMTISVYNEAEARSYSILIVATGKGTTRTTTYYLTIASPYSYGQQDLLQKLQAQIATIRAEILRLQKELAGLIGSGFFEK